MAFLTFLAAALALGYVCRCIYRVGKREAYLPPGPPTLPLLGNIHIFPRFFAHFQFSEWARQYGEIFSLKVGSANVIVISSAKAFREIIDKNSGTTADRPPNHFADTVTSGGLNIFLARYGEKWRSLRRGVHEILTPQASMNQRPLQDAESAQLMYDILRSPDDHFNAVRRFSSSLILSIVFGKRAPRFSTKEVTAFYHVQHIWEYLLFPGSFAPVDQIPWLKYVPERFARWKQVCREVRDLQRDLYFGLLEETEKRTSENGCFIETVIKRADEWGMDREMVGYLGGALIEGGSDTTSSLTNATVLAVTAFPESQRKAQEELDRVIGSSRAPEWEDLEELPYIRALLKEVHRFRPVAPLIPRAATADLTYCGYKIPAGSTIIANIWGILHDPEVYDDPEVFNPDRYMESDVGTKKDHENDIGQRNDLTFGGGRRICAGMHVAKYSLAINVMNLLWGFEFTPAKNAKGEEIKPDIWNFAQALASSPNPFQFTIKPRSAKHAEIIRQRFLEATPILQQFEHGISDDDAAFLSDIRSAASDA
ncbi:cytochrome P450 [Irpex rosettiformis]|uniref:Cytochrome P450 n=1 Tax=Irpex rosettiformis TaxID=378272 RepID=A0ACB8U341_9APHY|nr:cytochrome P450 [Irpex rosettiformis]